MATRNSSACVALNNMRFILVLPRSGTTRGVTCTTGGALVSRCAALQSVTGYVCGRGDRKVWWRAVFVRDARFLACLRDRQSRERVNRLVSLLGLPDAYA